MPIWSSSSQRKNKERIHDGHKPTAIALKGEKDEPPDHNENATNSNLHNLEESHFIWEECQAGFRRDAKKDIVFDRVDCSTELHMSLDPNRAGAARRLAQKCKKIPLSPCSIEFWVVRDKSMLYRKPPSVTVNSGSAGRAVKHPVRQSLRLSAVAA